MVRLLPERTNTSFKSSQDLQVEVWRGRPLAVEEDWTSRAPAYPIAPPPGQWVDVALPQGTREIDPLYLLASQLEWEYTADPSAAWEVISAARSPSSETRAHALSLLERTQELQPQFPEDLAYRERERRSSTKEVDMRAPYGLDVIESCMNCKTSRDGYFCRFSQSVLRSVDAASYHSVMPSGALLFVEGQTPRGVYVLCSGKVKLSTTSKEGKVLILKQAEAGEVLGLSAAVSGTNYEMTAETSTPCQLNFIGRQDLMTLLQKESEVGVRAAQSLSREFQGA
ncbi:MAG: cyclic nucleotide-binding domain-containing protein, partial [Candidatus Sulfotelmatobacter sp.]